MCSLIVYLTLQQLTTSIRLLFNEITYKQSKTDDRKGRGVVALYILGYLVMNIIAVYDANTGFVIGLIICSVVLYAYTKQLILLQNSLIKLDK